ncbi:MAG TPA: NAD(P)H-binding protein [Ktedonobacterales bacterium]|jgi:uncharacterized protein YbjT (DUF2867 family)|nr:NAD(P)H-binding protein [Ktedonobacterales bacterium]
MASVLVTGATGTLGRAVVHALLAGRHTARALSRRVQVALPTGAELVVGDLAQNTDLAEALTGVNAIIHCASDPKHAQIVDVEGTRRLLEAASGATPHLIYPSIVGIDRSAYPYYQAKLTAEQLIALGPLPWTILRATQFHDFVARLLRSFGVATSAEIVIPDGMRFQSVYVREVAARLVSFVERGPVGRDADMGGPEILTFDAMAAAYLRIRGRSATIRSANLSGALHDVFRSGVNLTPDHAQGVVTWDAWLGRRFPPDAAG